MQQIDYNSSILAALLSGINLASLAKRGDNMAERRIGPVLIPCCFDGSLVLFTLRTRHFNRNWGLNYLLFVASSLRFPTATPGAVTQCFGQLGETNPIEFFCDRSCPANSIHHHLPLSDRLIGRMCDRSMRSVGCCSTDNIRLMAQ